jgi:hypothetical protein
MSTREQLPYWIVQRDGYDGEVFLHGVVLGFEKSKWPIQAFAVDADGKCPHGAYWAAQQPQDRVLVGPIPIPDDAPVRSARRIPERIELTEVSA